MPLYLVTGNAQANLELVAEIVIFVIIMILLIFTPTKK